MGIPSNASERELPEALHAGLFYHREPALKIAIRTPSPVTENHDKDASY